MCMCVVKEIETDGELNASKVPSDLSSLAHSSMWEEWEGRNRLIMTCKGIVSASAHHASRFPSAGGLWFESGRNLKGLRVLRERMALVMRRGCK